MEDTIKDTMKDTNDYTCEFCQYCAENPHYGECGDIYTGYCNLRQKPIDFIDVSCEHFILEE